MRFQLRGHLQTKIFTLNVIVTLKGGGGGSLANEHDVNFNCACAERACKCSEVVLSLRRGQKGIPGSTPSVRKVSLIICNLTLRRGGGGGGGVKP